MTEATTIVEMDERGRVTIPQEVRKHLGVNGEATTIEITARTNA